MTKETINKRLSLRSFGGLFNRTSTPEKEDANKTSPVSTPSMDTSRPIPPLPAAVNGAPPSTSALIELAATITRETEKLNKYLVDKGLPIPSFDVDSPLGFPGLPKEAKRAREEVIRAAKELGDLVTGAEESIRWMAWDVRSSIPSFPRVFASICTDECGNRTTILSLFKQSIITKLVRHVYVLLCSSLNLTNCNS